MFGDAKDDRATRPDDDKRCRPNRLEAEQFFCFVPLVSGKLLL